MNYYDLNPADAHAMVSSDGHAMIMPVTLNESTGKDITANAKDEFVAAIARQGGGGIRVLSAGSVSADAAFNDVVSHDLAKAEIVGLPAALIVLVVVFGALVAAGLPILLGIVSIASRSGWPRSSAATCDVATKFRT